MRPEINNNISSEHTSMQDKSNSNNELSTYFINTSNLESRRFKERFGVLKKDHPIAIYIQTLFDEVANKTEKKDCEVIISTRWGQPNACVFPNGKIFISKELIGLCEYKEELEFIIGHELTHYTDGHSKKEFEIADNEKEDFVSSLIKTTGMRRLNEYIADAKPFVKLTERGINPYGGIVFTKKMIEYERENIRRRIFQTTDFVHGNAVDRLLNQLYVTHLADIETLSIQDLTPIPQLIRANRSKLQTLFETPQDKQSILLSQKHQFMQERIKTAESANILLITDCFSTIYHRLKQLTKKHNDAYLPNARSAFREQFDREYHILSILNKRIDSFMHTRYQNHNESQKAFIKTCYLELCADTKNAFEENEIIEEGLNDIKQGEKNINNELKSTTELQFDRELTHKTNNFISIINNGYEQIGASKKLDRESIQEILSSPFLEQMDVYTETNPLSFVIKITKLLKRYGFAKDIRNNETKIIRHLPHKNYIMFCEEFATLLEALYHQRGTTPVDKSLIISRLFEEGLDECADIKEVKQYIAQAKKRNITLDEPRYVKTLVALGYQKKEIQKVFPNCVIEGGSQMDTIDKPLTIENINNAQDILRLITILAERDFPQAEAKLNEYADELENFLQKYQKVNIHIENKNQESIENFVVLLSDQLAHMKEAGYVFYKKNDREKMSLDQSFEQISRSLEFFLIHSALSNVDKFSLLFNFLKKISCSDDLYFSMHTSMDYLSYYVSLYTLNSLDELLKIYKNTYEDEYFEKKFIPQKKTNFNKKQWGNEEINYVIEEWFFELLTKEALQTNHTQESFFALLAHIQNTIKITNLTIANITSGGRTEADGNRYDFLNSIFDRFHFDLNKRQNLEQLLTLVPYIDNVSLALQLQEILTKKLIENDNFEDAFQFIFSDANNYHFSNIKAFEDLIENKAQTHDQIERCQEKMLSFFLTDYPAIEEMGIAVLIEQLADNTHNSFDILRAFLETFESDLQLRKKLYRVGKQFPSLPKELDVYLNQLYRLDLKSKYLILRKCLCGRFGALMDEGSRGMLIDLFFDNFIKKPEFESSEGKTYQTLKEILTELAEKAQFDEIYFALSPLLMDRILRYPQHPANWREVIESENSEIKRLKFQKENTDDLDRAQIDEDIEEIVKKELDICQFNITGKITSENLGYENNIYTIIKPYIEEKEIQKITSVELVLEIAQKLGAMGVRFLQLLGQYIELPSEYQDSFNKVYDQIRGQYKLTAHNTLVREWPQKKETIATINKSIGGGSLVTVYKAYTTEGSPQALKVLNPNALFQLHITSSLMKRVFDGLEEKYKRKYALAHPVLEDIEEWIDNDVNSVGFLEKDKKFYEKFNEKITLGGYTIKIPKSYGPENKKFKREEYVETTNLTHLETLYQKGHNLKDITRLITLFFIKQLQDNKPGLVLSDIHVGNFGVTNKKEVVCFDRNYYLELDYKDNQLINGLIKNSNTPDKLAHEILKYIASSSDNQSILDKHIGKELIQSLASSGTNSFSEKAITMSRFLREKNVKIPLKITLLIKNINALHQLAQKVGFTGGLEEVMKSLWSKLLF